jgi:hypothetical protein
VPKSGTTFLQSALRHHEEALREAGVHYPCRGQMMFKGALDVRGDHQAWGRAQSEVAGSWDRLCDEARTHDGVTVISHELFGGASMRQVLEAQSMLAGLDVHVVVTARDLAAQVTAEWQEGIKHGRSVSFERFRKRILSGPRGHEHAAKFWASQDLPGVLSRWGAGLPAENVHLVCTPSQPADPLVLWRRFGEVVGFDPDAFDPEAFDATDPVSANRSLGITQIHLLRMVNASLDGRLVQPGYGRVVKQYFTKGLLAEHPSARPELPAEMYDELIAISERWATLIDNAGYTVHGDLSELVPVPPEQPTRHPDDADPHAEVSTAAAITAELLLEVHRLRAALAEMAVPQELPGQKRPEVRELLAQALGRRRS